MFLNAKRHQNIRTQDFKCGVNSTTIYVRNFNHAFNQVILKQQTHIADPTQAKQRNNSLSFNSTELVQSRRRKISGNIAQLITIKFSNELTNQLINNMPIVALIVMPVIMHKGMQPRTYQAEANRVKIKPSTINPLRYVLTQHNCIT